jgi:hypothetical protein
MTFITLICSMFYVEHFDKRIIASLAFDAFIMALLALAFLVRQHV